MPSGQLIAVILVVLLSQDSAGGDDSQYSIGGKKFLHRVSDKFLSFSVDPANLLTGITIGATSAKLGSNLSPAFVRLGGPSTSFVQYTEDEGRLEQGEWAGDGVLKVTPSMWALANDWLISANLTPVFAINDNDRTNGGWNPKTVLPLFDLSDKLNISCHFQLGYDCSNKTAKQYIEDLLLLKQIIDTYPTSSNWGLIGSDLSNLHVGNNEMLRKLLLDLQTTLEAVMWEPHNGDWSGFLIKDMQPKLFSTSSRQKVPLWTSAPKETHPVSFLSALDWGKSIGDAAKLGFKVIYRQLRAHELITDTPVFWVSLLHKSLMGQIVLETKSMTFTPQTAHFYAHCTKNQNQFATRGAITIFIINKRNDPHTTSLKLWNQQKKFEIHSYILTSSNENSTQVFLNGKTLTIEDLDQPKLFFKTEFKITNAAKHLSLNVPPRSISFFVIPEAKYSICSESEDKANFLLEEFERDKIVKFPEFPESALFLGSRHPAKIFHPEETNPTNLDDITHLIDLELKADQSFYNTAKETTFANAQETHKSDEKSIKLNVDPVEENPKAEWVQTPNDFMSQFTGRIKAFDKQKKLLDKAILKLPLIHKEKEELQLTSSEVKTILAMRRKSKKDLPNIIHDFETKAQNDRPSENDRSVYETKIDDPALEITTESFQIEIENLDKEDANGITVGVKVTENEKEAMENIKLETETKNDGLVEILRTTTEKEKNNKIEEAPEKTIPSTKKTIKRRKKIKSRENKGEAMEKKEETNLKINSIKEPIQESSAKENVTEAPTTEHTTQANNNLYISTIPSISPKSKSKRSVLDDIQEKMSVLQKSPQLANIEETLESTKQKLQTQKQKLESLYQAHEEKLLGMKKAQMELHQSQKAKLQALRQSQLEKAEELVGMVQNQKEKLQALRQPLKERLEAHKEKLQVLGQPLKEKIDAQKEKLELLALPFKQKLESRIGNIDVHKENFGTRAGKLRAQNETLGAQYENPGAQNENLGAQNENLGAQNGNLGAQNENFGVQNENLEAQNEALGARKEYLDGRKESLRVQKESLEPHKEILEAHKEVLKEKLADQKEKLKARKEKLEAQKEILQSLHETHKEKLQSFHEAQKSKIGELLDRAKIGDLKDKLALNRNRRDVGEIREQRDINMNLLKEEVKHHPTHGLRNHGSTYLGAKSLRMRSSEDSVPDEAKEIYANIAKYLELNKKHPASGQVSELPDLPVQPGFLNILEPPIPAFPSQKGLHGHRLQPGQNDQKHLPLIPAIPPIPKIPPLPKFDLFKFLHPTSSTAKPLITAPAFTLDLEGDDNFLGESNEFESNLEELGPLHEFQEDFGDQFRVKLDPVAQLPGRNRELWEMGNLRKNDGQNVRMNGDVDALLSDDTPLFTNDEAQMRKTAKNLENYFNKARQLQEGAIDLSFGDYDTMGDFEGPLDDLRFKRNEGSSVMKIPEYKTEEEASSVMKIGEKKGVDQNDPENASLRRDPHKEKILIMAPESIVDQIDLPSLILEMILPKVRVHKPRKDEVLIEYTLDDVGNEEQSKTKGDQLKKNEEIGDSLSGNFLEDNNKPSRFRRSTCDLTAADVYSIPLRKHKKRYSKKGKNHSRREKRHERNNFELTNSLDSEGISEEDGKNLEDIYENNKDWVDIVGKYGPVNDVARRTKFVEEERKEFEKKNWEKFKESSEKLGEKLEQLKNASENILQIPESQNEENMDIKETPEETTWITFATSEEEESTTENFIAVEIKGVEIPSVIEKFFQSLKTFTDKLKIKVNEYWEYINS